MKAGDRTIVELTEDDLRTISSIAHARNEAKVRRQIASKRFDPNKSDLQIHLLGVTGELAVAKYLGLAVDKTITLTGDSGADLLALDCLSIQVKVASRIGRDFATQTARVGDLRWDIGVLCYALDSRHVEIAGWISKVSFLTLAEIKNYGYGERLAIGQDRLYPPAKLLGTIANGAKLQKLKQS